MWTTVTLEDDVALELHRLQKPRHESFKETLNAVLRAGLAGIRGKRPSAGALYRTEPTSLGVPRLRNLDHISAVLAFTEAEDPHR